MTTLLDKRQNLNALSLSLLRISREVKEEIRICNEERYKAAILDIVHHSAYIIRAKGGGGGRRGREEFFNEPRISGIKNERERERERRRGGKKLLRASFIDRR